MNDEFTHNQCFMNRLHDLFARKNRDLLSIYFTAGHPSRDAMLDIIPALERGGTDLMEVGMPYSDPLADGPIIQRSSEAALRNGMTLDLYFEQIRAVRGRTRLPLIFMGYFNQVMQFGEEKFVQTCVDAGIDGLILPDLPLDEFEKRYAAMFREARLPVSLLITSQTDEARIRRIEHLSDGFVYMVSSAATTGAKTGISDAQLAYFQRIEAMQLSRPRLIGFGISDRETFQTACRFANGAIIGSAFIRALEAGGEDVAGAAEAFVQGILSPNPA